MNDILDFPPSVSKILMIEKALGTWDHVSTAVAMGRHVRDCWTITERKEYLSLAVQDFIRLSRPTKIKLITFSVN